MKCSQVLECASAALMHMGDSQRVEGLEQNLGLMRLSVLARGAERADPLGLRPDPVPKRPAGTSPDQWEGRTAKRSMALPSGSSTVA